MHGNNNDNEKDSSSKRALGLEEQKEQERNSSESPPSSPELPLVVKSSKTTTTGIDTTTTTTTTSSATTTSLVSVISSLPPTEPPQNKDKQKVQFGDDNVVLDIDSQEQLNQELAKILQLDKEQKPSNSYQRKSMSHEPVSEHSTSSSPWWSHRSSTAKGAIIGGGVAVLFLVVAGIYALSQKDKEKGFDTFNVYAKVISNFGGRTFLAVSTYLGGGGGIGALVGFGKNHFFEKRKGYIAVDDDPDPDSDSDDEDDLVINYPKERTLSELEPMVQKVFGMSNFQSKFQYDSKNPIHQALVGLMLTYGANTDSLKNADLDEKAKAFLQHFGLDKDQKRNVGDIRSKMGLSKFSPISPMNG